MKSITYQPEVWDIRPSNDPSAGALPLLKENEWPRLLEFYQEAWPGFDIVGDHGEHRARDGQRWWGIGALELKPGVAAFQVQFRKEGGEGYDQGNILSIFSWNGAPKLDPALDDVRYRGEGVYGWSRGQDSIAYGYGAESGPFYMWLWSDPTDFVDPRVGSDCLWGVHWWDNHVSLNPVFWPMRKGGTTPPPTGGQRIGYWHNGVLVGTVLLEAGMPLPSDLGSLVVIDDEGVVTGHANLE